MYGKKGEISHFPDISSKYGTLAKQDLCRYGDFGKFTLFPHASGSDTMLKKLFGF
jgi:hypothetical protein